MKGLNTSLAFFVNDCFSLMDRGFVFKLVKYYCSAVSIRSFSVFHSRSKILPTKALKHK